ncbi:MAG: hypothetical protein JRI68_27205 [Deltaproteobacteria bacterium]|nr:hypothetical protein [Deltaproteobacteria bacterium]
MMNRLPSVTRRAALPLLTVAAATLWPAGSALAQPCQTDVQCPGDLVCEAGQCKADSTAPPPTTTATAPPPTATATPPPPTATATAPPPATTPPPPVVPQPAANTVPVQFTPRQGNPQIIDLVTAAQCTAPCTLNLEPGTRKIRVGEADAEPVDLNIPPGGTTFSVGAPSPTLQTTKNVLVGIGIGGVALGGFIAIMGIVVMDAGETDEENATTKEEERDARDIQDSAVMVMAAGGVIGGVALLSAITGIIVGGADDDGTIQQALDHPLVPRVGFAPLPGDGAFGAASWRF